MISLSTLEANRCKYSGEGGVMKIFKGALVLINAIQSGGLYVLQCIVVYGTARVATSKASLDDSKLWHYRLGHMGKIGMKNLAKKGLIKVSCNLEFCEHCVFGKQKRVSFSPGIHRTRDALDYIHSDLWGPSHVTSRGGNSIDYSNLKVFGCPIYVYVNEGKLVPRDVKCIFLGYGSGVKGYRVWCPDPKYRKTIHSRDVTFNEDVIIISGKDFMPPHNVNNNHTEVHIENYEPANYLEAISSLEYDKWVVAMEEEVKSFHKNKTWELVKPSKEKHVISYKWLFKVKDGIPGVERNRYKARVLLSIVALQDLELEQLDVKQHSCMVILRKKFMLSNPKDFRHGNSKRSKMGKLSLSQTDYISKDPKKFNISRCKPVPTPLAPHFKLSSHECPKSKENKEDMSRVLYSSVVGSLMYAMVCTRPDLPMPNIGLSFKKGRASPNGVVGYVDSDYMGDLDERKSLSSYIFSHCGFAIRWYSSLQAITALSTTEAEYISSTKGVKEAIWLRGMLNEFGLSQEDHERRQVNRSPRLKDYQCNLVAYAFVAAAHIKNCEPANYLEAISSLEYDKWVVAMEEEVKSFHKNKTWELVKPSKEKHVISYKWLFKVKDGIPGVERNRYKARVLLSIVALQDLEPEQLDVKQHSCMVILRKKFMLSNPKTDYILKDPKKFNISRCKPVPTPLAPHFKLSSHECPKSKENKEDVSRVLYSSTVGSLMYAMVCTRPDLPMPNFGLSFKKGRASPNVVVGYVDSDYVGDLDARKSLSSYIFSHCGFAIHWYSSLQAITALSTTEPEYISSTKGVKEAIWLRGMLNEFGLS
nr:retrovirus-related Pol polyprotein from transposon TNT 1-94 [Tanacetum cinerariifolium]